MVAGSMEACESAGSDVTDETCACTLGHGRGGADARPLAPLPGAERSACFRREWSKSASSRARVPCTSLLREESTP